jgi:hypothetical protein
VTHPVKTHLPSLLHEDLILHSNAVIEFFFYTSDRILTGDCLLSLVTMVHVSSSVEYGFLKKLLAILTEHSLFKRLAVTLHIDLQTDHHGPHMG